MRAIHLLLSQARWSAADGGPFTVVGSNRWATGRASRSRTCSTRSMRAQRASRRRWPRPDIRVNYYRTTCGNARRSPAAGVNGRETEPPRPAVHSSERRPAEVPSAKKSAKFRRSGRPGAFLTMEVLPGRPRRRASGPAGPALAPAVKTYPLWRSGDGLHDARALGPRASCRACSSGSS